MFQFSDIPTMGNFTSKNWEEMTEMTEAQHAKEEAQVGSSFLFEYLVLHLFCSLTEAQCHLKIAFFP
jgi:hypothetical protein